MIKMNLTGKRIGSLLLTVCMVLTLLPLTAIPAHAAGGITYLDVGFDTDLDATQNQSGTGWDWNAGTNTFTLTGNITGSIMFYGGTGDVNFVVSGSHTVTPRIDQNVGGLTISGGGTLTVNSSADMYACLRVGGGLEISGTTVNINSGGSWSDGVYTDNGDITMSSGSLNITATGSGSLGISTNGGGDLIISGTASVSADSTDNEGIHCHDITVSGGTLSGTSGNNSGIYASGTLTISSGTVTAISNNTTWEALRSGGDIDVTGGSLTATGGSTGRSLATGGSLNVSGASADVTVNGNIRKISGNGGNLEVSNGTVAVTGNIAGNATVTGGAATITGTVSGTTTHTGGMLNGNTPPPAAAGTLNVGTSSGLDLAGDLNGTGWAWTASTATLELGSTYTGEAIYFDTTDPVNLVLTANVTIEDTTLGYALKSGGDLTIDAGSSTLTVSSSYVGIGHWGIRVDGNLNIIGGTVNAEYSGAYGSSSAIIAAGSVTIQDAVVSASATGTYGGSGILSGSSGILITGSSQVTATGKGNAGIALLGGSGITISGSSNVIASNPDGINIAIFVSDTNGNLTVSGSASLNSTPIDNSRISADNISIDTTGTVNAQSSTEGRAAITARDNISIQNGTVTATNTAANGSGIYSENSDIAISGGTVTVTAQGTGYALNARDGAGTVNISNGTVTATNTTTPANAYTGTLNHTGGTLNGNNPPPDTTAPTLTAGTANRTSDTAATVRFTSNEAGAYYYEVAASGAAQPSINTNGAGVSCDTTQQTITLTTLTAGAKDIYIVVKDAAGNVSAATFKIAIPAYSGDDNSSDDNGGGSTTPSTPAPTVSGTTATTTVTPTVTNGTASASVTVSQMNDALQKAQEAARTNGGKPQVEIKLAGASGARAAQATIPGASVQALSSGGVGGLSVSSGIASITFDTAALSTISGASSGDVTVTASRVDASALPAAAQALVGDRPVFEFSVRRGDSAISQFGGSVSVSVPYTPSAGEDPNAVIVSYISADGNLETVMNGRYDAATGMVTFTTTHFSQYAVGYNKVSFTDVADSAWYADAVTFLAARGITGGTTATTFGPDATLTRGQFITMLLRAYGVEADTNPSDNFSDAGDTYYTGYLAAAKRMGISSGVGDNRFAPEQAITRQEMFTLLYNALKALDKLPSGDMGKTLSDFTDVGQIDTWAKDAMTLLVRTGTVDGNAGKLTPTGTTTRAQMAQVLYNLIGK